MGIHDCNYYQLFTAIGTLYIGYHGSERCTAIFAFGSERWPQWFGEMRSSCFFIIFSRHITTEFGGGGGVNITFIIIKKNVWLTGTDAEQYYRKSVTLEPVISNSTHVILYFHGQNWKLKCSLMFRQHLFVVLFDVCSTMIMLLLYVCINNCRLRDCCNNWKTKK